MPHGPYPNRRAVMTAVVFAGTLVAGCGPSTPELKLEDPSTYDISTTRDGLAVGVVPIFDRTISRDLLGADVTHMFMPLLVVMQNQSKDVFLVERARMLLSSSDGQEMHAISWERMALTFEYSKGDPDAWSPAGATRARNPDSAMAQSWRLREFPSDRMLRQGQRVGGFVYFRKNAGQPPFSIAVDGLNMRSQKTNSIVIELPAILE